MAVYQVWKAKNDANGNPRRVTVRFNNDGSISAKHIDRYDGDGIRQNRKPGDTVLPDVQISPAKYREMKKLSVPEF